MDKVKLLAFAGSARKKSYNKLLVQIAATGAEAAGAEVTVLDLADYPMALFNEDDEAAHGLDANAKQVKELMKASDGFIISCPEYNGFMTPLLKNTIDWASRSEEGDTPLVAYKGKTALLLAASPGGFGGMRGLPHVRTLLSGIGVIVMPDQMGIPAAYEAFSEDGSLKDEKKQAAVLALGAKLVKFTGGLKE